MLTISPLNKTNAQLYNNKSIKQKDNHFSSINFTHSLYNLENTFDFYENSNIINSNTNYEIQKRPLSRESTIKKTEEVFSEYKKNLNEINIETITESINNIEKNTNYSRPEILNAMQKATQFGNMKSLNVIEKELNKNNIGFLIYNRNPLSKTNLDLNTTLNYFFTEKNLGYINGEKIGIILDKNKLEELEEIKQKSPETYNKNKDNNIVFFILSGFNDGINFINKNRDLTKTTKLFLEKKENIDEEIINRCKKLGIKPIIIKNNNDSNNLNELNIYNQLAPKQMTSKELNAVIDATVMYRISSPNERIDAKTTLVEYLNNNLIIYTPEKLANSIKNLYENLKLELSNNEQNIDDVVYIIPNAIKSFTPINYQYQQINNVDRNKFINIDNLSKLNNLKDKTFIVIDDCAISGESFKEIGKDLRQITQNNIIYAPIYTSLIAENEINIDIFKDYRNKQEKLIKTDSQINIWNKNINDKNNFIYKLLGDIGFENGYDCLIFPYMSPDNNSEFAGNISLLHHINYNKNNLNLNKYKSIKELTPNNIEIAELSEKLLEKETK